VKSNIYENQNAVVFMLVSKAERRKEGVNHIVFI